MKTIVKYSAFAAFAMAVSCSEVVTEVEPMAPAVGNDTQTLIATVPSSQTKVSFAEGTAGIEIAWAEGDTFSVYQINGAWVSDFVISDLETSTFATVAGGTDLVDGSSYIAVYPANGATTYAEYAATNFTSSQSADASASLDHLTYACQMSDEFTFGSETIIFAHNKAIMTIQFDDIPVGATPTKVQLSDGVNSNYSLTLSNMAASEVVDDTDDATYPLTVYEVYMMIDPAEATSRNLTFTITHTDGVNIYNITSTKEYSAGYRYTAPVKNQNEQQGENTGYWQAIGTAEELTAYLTSASFTKNTVLTADIDMANETVSAPSAYMGKIFDGNGYTISNLTITSTADQVGMFKGLNGTTYGFVKNLTLQSPRMTGTQYVGAIVGKQTASTTIYNCVVKDAVIVATTNQAGGISGQCQGGSIIGCSFSGSVESQGSTNAGGIVGISSDSALIADCIVEAGSTITTTTTNAGGIVGNATGVTISNCSVLGSVKATTNIVGGIVGVLNAGSVIYGCVNGATIDGVQKVGGLVGEIAAGGDLVACYNYGAVGTTRTTGSTGGLVGQNTSESVITNVTGCYNSNTTEGNITNGNVLGYVKSGDYVVVTDCYCVAETAKNGYGTAVADIEALNEKVESMNTAINKTSYSSYNYVSGIATATDLPTLIEK